MPAAQSTTTNDVHLLMDICGWRLTSTPKGFSYNFSGGCVAFVLIKTGSHKAERLMERPTLTSLAWSDTGELSNEARATQETIERLRQFDGEVILTREEITRVYQFKADEIRQYQEWLQSPVLSNEDKDSINKCIQQVVEEIVGILTLVPADYCTEALGV